MLERSQRANASICIVQILLLSIHVIRHINDEYVPSSHNSRDSGLLQFSPEDFQIIFIPLGRIKKYPKLPHLFFLMSGVE